MTVVIHSAVKVDADGVVEDFWLAFTGSTLAATGTGTGWHGWSTAENAVVVNAAGRWLTPGFIDVHSHGGGGFSFDNGTEAIQGALAMHRAHGTTRSVISLVANPVEVLCESLELIADLVEADPLILGSHLEGPFLARNHRGAHNPAHLRTPTAELVDTFLAAGRGTIRQVTLAPELTGALDAIDRFVAAGVTVGVGHTDADFRLTKEAFDRGATLLTHAFNAMPGIKHREPGPVTAALGDPRVALELILDGFHVHPEVARVAFFAAPMRILLITDAMAAAGSVDGHYKLGDLNVSVSDGRAMLSGTTTIAGSTLTQDVALRSAIFDSETDPVLAVRALTASPARALGLDETLGYLAPGYAADVVLLGTDWTVDAVWAAGRPMSDPT
ncbi:N-acetylglucosamine-6-phosphate deacetylase [Subtercola boreus]|uniref:N-acetylglucosamine-6-phosphate deacetylase n=1 Tax=Subtercola boreus TaxID=120213 RepID=A0A3E0VKP6_9MICO|nr:N-acetylglucosamine-6-phosphate deacetylase [Subtercola boreus]RFA10013.1 N-acetylglucosamine-6-phosphate deacetylase [Subtercola boreus]TQL52840.1 N-acetylglucosamine 6-phosphate deacetylase [Subtercola boreus]